MCGRYRRTTSEEELARLYRIPIPPQRELPISWNIAPSQDVLVIRYNPKAKQRSLDALRWGADPLLGKRSEGRLQDNQCQSRNGRHRAVLP
jgi:putative SOS response-associated peptidase YedK